MSPQSVTFSRRFDDPDEASSILSGSYSSVNVSSLHSSSFNLGVSAVVRPFIQIYKSTTASGIVFDSRERFAGFNYCWMHAGVSRSSSGTRTYMATPAEPLLTDAREVDRNTMTADAVLNGAALTANFVQKALSDRLDGEAHKPFRFKDGSLPSTVSNGLEVLCEVLYSGIANAGFLVRNAIATKNIEDAIAHILLNGVDSNYYQLLQHGFSEAPKVVRKAIDFINANAHLPISSGDIAIAVGLNVRSLQLAFRRWRDTTPHAYLRSVRLRSARSEILADGGRIGDIAKKWGFNSSGEFSRLYLECYGELPTTARRRTTGS